MMCLVAVDLGKLKSQAVCLSATQSLNHAKKKEIFGQRQQVLIEIIVLMRMTKSLVKTKHLTYLLPYFLQVHGF